jgi:hypothetical protein
MVQLLTTSKHTIAKYFTNPAYQILADVRTPQ